MGTNSINWGVTMSFIDLMSNDVWTEADIIRRTESMIRSEYSLEHETILNRKALGSTLGTYQLTEEDQYELMRYTAVAENARVECQKAIHDMNVLQQVFAYEEAEKVLSVMSLEDALLFIETLRPEELVNEENGEILNNEELEAYDKSYDEASRVISQYGNNIEQNALDRFQAQTTIDSATDEVVEVVNMRKNTF